MDKDLDSMRLEEEEAWVRHECTCVKELLRNVWRRKARK